MRKLYLIFILLTLLGCSSYNSISEKKYKRLKVKYGSDRLEVIPDETEVFSMRTIMKYSVMGEDLAVRRFITDNSLGRTDLEQRDDISVVGEHILVFLDHENVLYITPRFFLSFKDMDRRFRHTENIYVSNLENVSLGMYETNGDFLELNFYTPKGSLEMQLKSNEAGNLDELEKIKFDTVSNDLFYKGKQDLSAPLAKMPLDSVFAKDFKLEYADAKDRTWLLGKGPEVSKWLQPFMVKDDTLRIEKVLLTLEKSTDEVKEYRLSKSSRNLTRVRDILIVAKTANVKKRFYRVKRKHIVRNTILTNSVFSNQKR